MDSSRALALGLLEAALLQETGVFAMDALRAMASAHANEKETGPLFAGLRSRFESFSRGEAPGAELEAPFLDRAGHDPDFAMAALFTRMVVVTGELRPWEMFANAVLLKKKIAGQKPTARDLQLLGHLRQFFTGGENNPFARLAAGWSADPAWQAALSKTTEGFLEFPKDWWSEFAPQRGGMAPLTAQAAFVQQAKRLEDGKVLERAVAKWARFHNAWLSVSQKA